MAWGDILLFGCAFATLACFGAIFLLGMAAIREQRSTDPMAEAYGDVPAWPENGEMAAARETGGDELLRAAAGTHTNHKSTPSFSSQGSGGSF